jgi:hypothetical protein
VGQDGGAAAASLAVRMLTERLSGFAPPKAALSRHNPRTGDGALFPRYRAPALGV